MDVDLENGRTSLQLLSLQIIKETIKLSDVYFLGQNSDMQMIHTLNENFDSHDFVNNATKHFVREA
jgi:hypothetical protein